MKTNEYSLDVDGKKLEVTITDLADQANGSVIVKLGNTAVLATAVMSNNERNDIDYFPLVVDYEEKFYAAGLVLGGRYLRREGRPSEEAILTGRMVDRTIRPLFDHSFRKEVQVVITVLSIDEENDPDIISIFAASLALSLSDIPWNGPIGAVRIGAQVESYDLAINPTYSERKDAKIDSIFCGQEGTINMIEAGANEVSEDDFAGAIDKALVIIKKLVEFQNEIVSKHGKEKVKITKSEPNLQIAKLFDEKIGTDKFIETLYSANDNKNAISKIALEWNEIIKENLDEADKNEALQFLEKKFDEVVHNEILTNNRRPDNRALDEVRPLVAIAGGISDVLHGVGIFYRGETHVMSVLTLGGPQDSLVIEGMETREKKYFMHHYNFPPFSSGETGRLGGANRRAIGHGALAEKALLALIPKREEFPYTIRVVSEALASNGSTSMASVCASSLALFDGGVPMKKHVAGIAMGLIATHTKEGKIDKYKVLTDIQGPEDHFGDMDLKVAGTKDGITALQMDVKVSGVTKGVLIDSFQAAKKARIHILETMNATLPEAHTDLRDAAPRVDIVTIDTEKIGLLIGPGGKTIKNIIEKTEASIEVDQIGEVFISGKKDAVLSARAMIEDLLREYKVGDRAEGEVSKIFDFGAVVTLGPNADGLVHISELAPHRVEKVTDVVCLGDKVPVIVKDVDDRGRLSLSIVKADPEFAKKRGTVVCKELPESSNLRYNKKNGADKGPRNTKH